MTCNLIDFIEVGKSAFAYNTTVSDATKSGSKRTTGRPIRPGIQLVAVSQRLSWLVKSLRLVDYGALLDLSKYSTSIGASLLQLARSFDALIPLYVRATVRHTRVL